VLTYHPDGIKTPKKYQLLVKFDDCSALSAAVRLYGGLWCFNENDFDNPYYEVAKEIPSPLFEEFDNKYFFGFS
jgi:formamidopyrimidine-DNA glycosylase